MRKREDSKPDYWSGANKSYTEIWQWLLNKHSPYFTSGFNQIDLERVHKKWTKLGKES